MTIASHLIPTWPQVHCPPWSPGHHQVQYSQWDQRSVPRTFPRPGLLTQQWHSPPSAVQATFCYCLTLLLQSLSGNILMKTRAPGMNVASCCWVKWKECCKFINKSAFIQFLMLDRTGNNRFNGNCYCSVWAATTNIMCSTLFCHSVKGKETFFILGPRMTSDRWHVDELP